MPGRDLAARLRKLWRRLALRGPRQGEDPRRYNRFYLLRNPWSLDTGAEEIRFRETTRVIREVFGEVATLLEVGCGEGHQSLHLRGACRELVGIDLSRRAVRRARRRCPGARFLVSDLAAMADRHETYDLVVACEVLYYMSDPAGALRRAATFANGVLVSYFGDEIPHLDPIVLPILPRSTEITTPDGHRWRLAWSEPRQGPRGAATGP
jgi:SAM-dependent methyltransferase